jgi:hypothetical protein
MEKWEKKWMVRYRWRKAHRLSAKRKVAFHLTFEEYRDAVSKECFYCDGFFGRVRYCIGLDRLDNAKSYETGNVVSCCEVCNRVKADIFTPLETRLMIQVVKALKKRI